MAGKKIEFLAIIPPIQSALRFGGDAGRVTFEVPKSEISKAVALIALQDVVLKVTVEVSALTRFDDNGSKDSQQANKRAARNPLDVDRG